MFKFVPIIFICACAVGGEGLDVWNKHKDGLYKAAKEYIKEFSTEKDWKKWDDNINEKMETRSLEAVALDWFSDNQSNLENKLPSAITKACYFFIKFVDTKTLPPSHIRANITSENMQLLQDYLEQCVDRVKEEKK